MNGKKERMQAPNEAAKDLTAGGAVDGGEGAQTAGESQPQAQPVPSAEPHRPAVQPRQKKPALPYDRHHGQGGMYAVIDGKRVRADDDGNPLPPEKH